MKKITFLILTLLVSATGFAQLTTPGTGETYDLSELSALDSSILSYDGTKYILSEDLTISANDILEITTPDTLFVDAGKRITVEGDFLTNSGDENDKFVIRATDTLNPFDGIRFEEFSVGSISNTEITYSGGLKVMTESFAIENSYLAYNVSGVATGATISLSRGAPTIENNTFYKNDLPAVGSGGNQSVAAQISDNWIEKNGQSNGNRPQLNMGPTGQDTLKITNNTIIGDRDMTEVGGIGISNFFSADVISVIEGNTIQDNRYGVTVAGPTLYTSIKANIIEDNDSQNNPALGGSGISVNSGSDSQTIIVSENEIRGHLWGITVIDEGSVNLGTVNNYGHNVFSENGNGGVTYALYNNTPNDMDALGNCWIEADETAGATEIEEVIFHQIDDSTLGLVDYSNWTCGTLGTEIPDVADLNIYPNPAQNSINFTNKIGFEVVEFFSIKGQLLKTAKLQEGQNQIDLALPQGLYMLRFSNDKQSLTEKLVIK